MTTESGIWNQIVDNLGSKLSRSEIKTWFSQVNCNSYDNNLAIIEVPNKFVARWLRENYLNEINNSFKEIFKETPDIHFVFNKKNTNLLQNKSHDFDNRDKFLNNNLNKSMNFDNYIRGEFNKFAVTSAIEISKRPGNSYNPFYIFSKFSTGKTHLLNAIGNHILEKDQSLRVEYVYSKNFISEFNNSLRYNNFNSFKNKYHNLDILLFDDIQHLANFKKLQEEFVSIFNNIYTEKKQIVITGDRPPGSLKNINSQLKSRLGWGLITEIREVDYKIKNKIIKNKLKNINIDISNDIISLLLKSNKDIKTLLKNIVRLETYISLNNKNINLSLFKSLIKDRGNTRIEVKEIQSITSKYFNIQINDLVSDKKKSIYSYPRHIAIYLSRKYTDLSFKEIGYLFGNRDHSTIIYAIRKIEKLKSRKKNIKNDINNIVNLLT
jgi:chromosomal replication initiator protein